MTESRINQQGMSIIELLVVISISSMLLITTSMVFLNMTMNRLKTQLQQETKTEGQNALAHMELFIREAAEVETCNLGMSDITIRNLDDHKITFDLRNDKIRKSTTIDGTTKRYKLTSDRNKVKDLKFDCEISDNGDYYYVYVKFTLENNRTLDNNKTISQRFNTGIALRN